MTNYVYLIIISCRIPVPKRIKGECSDQMEEYKPVEKTVSAFLNFFGSNITLDRSKLTREISEQATISLFVIISILLKSESLGLNNDLDLQDSSDPLSNEFEDCCSYIKAYLKNFNTQVFKFSRTEKQTFIFIIENLEDYFKNVRNYRLKKEKESFFADFTFWFDNFFKVFEQKISGTLIISGEKDTPGECVMFSFDELSIPLTPFVQCSGGSVLILGSIEKKGLRYSDLAKEKSLIIADRILLHRLYVYLLRNLAFEQALRLIGLKGDTYPKVLKNAEMAVISVSEENFAESNNYIKNLPSPINTYPMFFLIRLEILENTGKHEDLKLQVDKFIRKYPRYYQGFKIRARIYEKEGRYKTAIENYEKAYSINYDRELSEKIKKLRSILKKGREVSKQGAARELFFDISEKVTHEQNFLYQRDRELRQAIEILISSSRNNLMLVGESGVGKSTFLKILADRINRDEVPAELKGISLKEINFVSLLIGTKYRGQFEEKVVKVLEEFKSENSLLVLEDIHLMISPGTARGTSLDLVNILKQFLRDGSIRVIATSTYDEYKNSLEKDQSFLSHFQRVNVKEMSKEETEIILKEHAKKSILNDDIIVPDSIIELIIENGTKNFFGKKLPDSAIMIFDRVISKVKYKGIRKSEPVFKVTEDDIAEVISDLMNLPEAKASVSMKEKLSNLEKNINREIIGQKKAVSRLVSGIISSKLGFEVNSSRPDGVFLFVGPTGVGKSETALVLSEYLLGSRENVIRIDMSEYMEKFTYSRFVGAAPGYVGYNDATQLTDKVRKNPYSVILLDEIEKADYQLLNIFLQVFDAGRLTDARGNVVDFSHATIIMTSNIGTSLYSRQLMGYNSSEKGERVSDYEIDKSVKKFFSPEFINRIDDIIVFDTLERKDIEKIIDLQLSDTVKKLSADGKSLNIPKNVIEKLIDKGYSAQYGARNIGRTIKKSILEKIAHLSLLPEWETMQTVEFYLKGEINAKFSGSSVKFSTVNFKSVIEEESGMDGENG